jgi:hypothetical protein
MRLGALPVFGVVAIRGPTHYFCNPISDKGTRDMVKTLVVFVFGALIGGLIVWKMPAMGQAAGKDQVKVKADTQVDVPALNDDVARLKNITPNLSHVMADVAFQYSNLWFAGQKKNWPLAMFYYNETRGRIRWMLRINPMPKTPEGEVVNLQGIFDGIDTSSLAMLKQAIEKKDVGEFTSAYKLMLDSCYSCHKSAGRPYLRPVVPTTPPQTIIDFNPATS